MLRKPRVSAAEVLKARQRAKKIALASVSDVRAFRVDGTETYLCVKHVKTKINPVELPLLRDVARKAGCIECL